jgi:hypothetical protein
LLTFLIEPATTDQTAATVTTYQYPRRNQHSYTARSLSRLYPRASKLSHAPNAMMIASLTALLLLAPVPMIQVLPASVISLLSLAYLEEDGVLLSISLFAAITLLGIAAAAVWETVVGVAWIHRIW